MGSTPYLKNRLPPGFFLLGSHLTSFSFIIEVFIGLLGESFEIQFLDVFGNILYRFLKGI